MKRHILTVIGALTLTACAASAPVPTAPVAIPAPVVLTPQAAAESRFVDRMDAQTAVRTLVSVVDRIEPVAEAACREAGIEPNCNFEFAVDANPLAQPNAFQTLVKGDQPLIAFTASLVAEARNADELAFILSHEAAHHILGHIAQQRQAASIGAAVMGQLVGLSDDPRARRDAAAFGAAVGARTYSQQFELEADVLGTQIAARAGFNPLRGAEFFFRIPDPGNTFLGSHPANADRVRVVQATARSLGY
ncbi:M48 family metallopeptidase [Loktanella sp. SALINAS62]|uniref:M48 family metallopeptidase n=1 Tax=Loktanella sp. SALINAS62 TaxID=2706124 RepID=UPI0032C3DC45